MEAKDEHSVLPQELLLAMQPLISTVVRYGMLHAFVSRCCVNVSTNRVGKSTSRAMRLDEDQIVSIQKLMVEWALKKTTEASLKQVTATSPGHSEYSALERSTPRGTTVLIGVAADADGWSNKVSRAKKLAYVGATVDIHKHNEREKCANQCILFLMRYAMDVIMVLPDELLSSVFVHIACCPLWLLFLLSTCRRFCSLI